jgi:hypothetical protein
MFLTSKLTPLPPMLQDANGPHNQVREYVTLDEHGSGKLYSYGRSNMHREQARARRFWCPLTSDWTSQPDFPMAV